MPPPKAAGGPAKRKAVAQNSQHPTLGFGVPATSAPHHFTVTIPRSSTGWVQISEYLGLQATTDEHAVIDRVLALTGYSRTFLMGHSLGGLCAAAAAARQPP